MIEENLTSTVFEFTSSFILKFPLELFTFTILTELVKTQQPKDIALSKYIYLHYDM